MRLVCVRLTYLALVFTGLPPASAANPLDAFVHWTNDQAEKIWGFESNCAKSNLRQSNDKLIADHCALKNPFQLGLTLEELEEWTWITEAMRLREAAMEANKKKLNDLHDAVETLERGGSPDPRHGDEIARIERNMIAMAQIQKQLARLKELPSILCNFFDRACEEARTKEYARRDEEKLLLFTAQDEILAETPILSHFHLRHFVEQIEIGYEYTLGDKNFRTNLKKAALAAINVADDRIAKYAAIKGKELELAKKAQNSPTEAEKIINVEGYRDKLKSVRQDYGLLEELLVTERPQHEPGLDQLYAAACRLENRVLKNKAVGELRGLALNAALTASSTVLLLRSASATKEAARVVATTARAQAIRQAGFALLETGWAVSDFMQYQSLKKTCEDIALTALTVGNDRQYLDGRSVGQAYEDCRHELSDQKLASIVNRVPALMSLRSLFQGSRVAERAVTGFLDKILGCIPGMSAEAKKNAVRRQAWSQLGINWGFTVVGYVAGSSGKNVDWANLPVDMIVGGAATFLEPYFATSKGPFRARYARMLGLGATKSGIEAGLYIFNPANSDKPDRDLIALGRGAYSTTWAAGNSVVKIGLNNFLLGLECAYHDVKIVRTASGLIQVAFRAGSSFGYFYVRNQAISAMGLDSALAPKEATAGK